MIGFPWRSKPQNSNLWNQPYSQPTFPLQPVWSGLLVGGTRIGLGRVARVRRNMEFQPYQTPNQLWNPRLRKWPKGICHVFLVIFFAAGFQMLITFLKWFLDKMSIYVQPTHWILITNSTRVFHRSKNQVRRRTCKIISKSATNIRKRIVFLPWKYRHKQRGFGALRKLHR